MATQKTDGRPLYERRLSCELRIAALESALFAARECHKEIVAEAERAETIPAPPMPANDNAACELEGWVEVAL